MYLFLDGTHQLSKEANLKHFISTRQGGTSQSPYNDLNLGFLDDEVLNVINNRQLLADTIGLSVQDFVFQEQIHSCNVKRIVRTDSAAGLYSNETRILASDAMITNEQGLCLMVMSADCVPILLYDPSSLSIAVVHAGWKGTLGKLAKTTIEAMVVEFDANPSQIIAGIGPSISMSYFEVGAELAFEFETVFGSSSQIVSYNKQTSKPIVDLWKANQNNLVEAGLKIENIEISNLCSFQRSNLFFSYRRDKGQTGRYAGGVFLNNLE